MVHLHTLGDLLVDPDLPFGQPCCTVCGRERNLAREKTFSIMYSYEYNEGSGLCNILQICKKTNRKRAASTHTKYWLKHLLEDLHGVLFRLHIQLM